MAHKYKKKQRTELNKELNRVYKRLNKETRREGKQNVAIAQLETKIDTLEVKVNEAVELIGSHTTEEMERLEKNRLQARNYAATIILALLAEAIIRSDLFESFINLFKSTHEIFY